MAFTFGKRIVTDGLAFYVDAANPISYNGTVTSWKDLTKSNLNGTLTNSPVFTSTSGSGIIFDSASLQTFAFPNLNISTSAFTIDLWMKPASYKGFVNNQGNGNAGGANWPGILSTTNIVDYTSTLGTPLGVAIGFYGSSAQLYYGAVCTGSFAIPRKIESINYTGSVCPNLTTSSIYNIILQRNTDTNHLEMYLDGVYLNKVYLPSDYWPSGSIPLRSSIRSISSTDSYYPNGTYYSIKIYKNKYLTQDEVTQNYNALKYKYS
jgi:hypothetical protein